MYARLYEHIYVWMRKCICICMKRCMYECIYVPVCMNICMCEQSHLIRFPHTRVHTYMHTYMMLGCTASHLIRSPHTRVHTYIHTWCLAAQHLTWSDSPRPFVWPVVQQFSNRQTRSCNHASVAWAPRIWSMNLCVYVCMYVCVYIYIYTCRYILCMYVFNLANVKLRSRLCRMSTPNLIYKCFCVCMCMCVCIYIHMYLSIYSCTCICMYVCVPACMPFCDNMHACIHTYI
jgi:hypothetical protein